MTIVSAQQRPGLEMPGFSAEYEFLAWLGFWLLTEVLAADVPSLDFAGKTQARGFTLRTQTKLVEPRLGVPGFNTHNFRSRETSRYEGCAKEAR